MKLHLESWTCSTANKLLEINGREMNVFTWAHTYFTTHIGIEQTNCEEPLFSVDSGVHCGQKWYNCHRLEMSIWLACAFVFKTGKRKLQYALETFLNTIFILYFVHFLSGEKISQPEVQTWKISYIVCSTWEPLFWKRSACSAFSLPKVWPSWATSNNKSTVCRF